jgi:hypothetical protein
MYSTSVSTASVDIGNGGGEGIPALNMLEKDGELCPLHAEAAPIELVVNGGERIQDAVKLAGELDAFVLKTAVSVYFSGCGWVVEVAGFFNEGVETSIPAGEDGEEPQSCCLGNGGLSIVRPEEKLCDVGGFPRLPPNSSTCPFLTNLIHSRTTIQPPPIGTVVVTCPSLCSKPLGTLNWAQSSLQLSVVLCLLLVDSLELLNFLLGFGDLLSILGRSLMYSGCKPIGCGTDGGIECRVKGEDCLSQCWRDRQVVVTGEVNEAGDGPMVAV